MSCSLKNTGSLRDTEICPRCNISDEIVPILHNHAWDSSGMECKKDLVLVVVDR